MSQIMQQLLRWFHPTLAVATLCTQQSVGPVHADTASVRVRMTATNAGGFAISEAMVGEPFSVDVFIQDIRDPNDPTFDDLDGMSEYLGVFSAFFDFRHSLNLDLAGDFVHGPDYMTLNSGAGIEPFPVVSPGLIEDLGGAQTDLLSGPQGPAEFLLVSLPFRGIDAAFAAVDDSFQATPGINTIPVLDNDVFGSEVTVRREPADGGGKDILLLLAASGDPDSQLVTEQDIVGDRDKRRCGGLARSIRL